MTGSAATRGTARSRGRRTRSPTRCAPRRFFGQRGLHVGDGLRAGVRVRVAESPVVTVEEVADAERRRDRRPRAGTRVGRRRICCASAGAAPTTTDGCGSLASSGHTDAETNRPSGPTSGRMSVWNSAPSPAPASAATLAADSWPCRPPTLDAATVAASCPRWSRRRSSLRSWTIHDPTEIARGHEQPDHDDQHRDPVQPAHRLARATALRRARAARCRWRACEPSLPDPKPVKTAISRLRPHRSRASLRRRALGDDLVAQAPAPDLAGGVGAGQRVDLDDDHAAAWRR